ncbi:MAG TPA: GAF domain-containing protein, partial [Rhodothermia bacterium]|nr:GAF domain-containing protein [Rhodothermia bacterium]
LRHEGILYVASNDGVSYLDEGSLSFPEVSGITEQVFGLVTAGGDLLVGGSQTGVFKIEHGSATMQVGSADRTYSVATLYVSRFDSQLVYAPLSTTVMALKRRPDGTWREVGQTPELLHRVGVVAEERPGVLWVSSSVGAYRFSFPVSDEDLDIQAASFDYYGAEKGLPEIGGIPYHVQDEIVVMTRGEIYRYDPDADSFVRAPALEAVSSDGGYNDLLSEDNDGRIWIGMGREVAVGTPQPDGTISWNSAPFLRLAGSQTNYIYPEPDGTVWFATLDGLLKYDPKLGAPSTEAPPALIRSVIAGDDSLLSVGTANEAPAAELSYHLNAVEFRYSTPSYAEAGKNRFQTMLEGFDHDWSAWSHEHRRSYTNLPPGEYRFRVRSRNITDVEGEEATFAFSVLPPWYRAWWAYLLYTLAIAGGLVGFVRVRTRHLEARHRELEQVVEDRTSEINQRVEELAVINSVQQGLVAEMDMQGIYDLVGNRIRDLFDAQVVVIRTFDREQELEVFQFAIEKGERLDVPPRPFDALSRYMMEHHEPLFFNENYAQEMTALGLRTSTKGDAPKSAMFQPLIVGDQIKGNLSIQNVDREHAFSDSDVRLLATLANSMSVALENARLFDQTTRLLAESDQRAAELSTVNEISRALVSQLEFDALVQLVGDKIRETFMADMAYVAFLDEDEGMIKFPYGYGDDFPPMQFGEGFTSQILRTGEPLLVNEDVSGTFEDLGIQEIGKATASYLGVPVTVGRR